MLITGRGPFGFVGIQGLWYRLLLRAQESSSLRFLHQPWLNSYDAHGNRAEAAQLASHFLHRQVLSELPHLDKALAIKFAEENRCAVHFFMLLLVAADTKLRRETVRGTVVILHAAVNIEELTCAKCPSSNRLCSKSSCERIDSS